MGNDVTVTLAAQAGQLQLNVMEPIIAYALFNSITHLRNACITYASRCVTGITANREHLRRMVENSIGIVTALNPHRVRQRRIDRTKKRSPQGGACTAGAGARPAQQRSAGRHPAAERMTRPQPIPPQPTEINGER